MARHQQLIIIIGLSVILRRQIMYFVSRSDYRFLGISYVACINITELHIVATVLHTTHISIYI